MIDIDMTMMMFMMVIVMVTMIMMVMMTVGLVYDRYDDSGMDGWMDQNTSIYFKVFASCIVD